MQCLYESLQEEVIDPNIDTYSDSSGHGEMSAQMPVAPTAMLAMKKVQQKWKRAGRKKKKGRTEQILTEEEAISPVMRCHILDNNG